MTNNASENLVEAASLQLKAKLGDIIIDLDNEKIVSEGRLVKVNELDSRNKLLESELAEMRAAVRQLLAEKSETDEKNCILHKKLNDIENQHANSLAQSKSSTQKIEMELSSLAEQREAAIRTESKLRNENDEMKASNQILVGAKERYEREISNLQQKLSTCVEEKNVADKTVSRIREEMSDMKQKLIDKTQALDVATGSQSEKEQKAQEAFDSLSKRYASEVGELRSQIRTHLDSIEQHVRTQAQNETVHLTQIETPKSPPLL